MNNDGLLIGSNVIAASGGTANNTKLRTDGNKILSNGEHGIDLFGQSGPISTIPVIPTLRQKSVRLFFFHY